MNFLEPRFAISIISVWMLAIGAMMYSSGFLESDFFRFGPSDNIYFFKTSIDNWFKWSMLISYVICNQVFTTYGLQTISPWMLNVVENRNIKTISLPKWQTLSIIEIWYIYLWLGRIISIQIMLTQIDFLLIILIIDLVMTFIVNNLYLNEKLNEKNINLYSEY